MTIAGVDILTLLAESDATSTIAILAILVLMGLSGLFSKKAAEQQKKKQEEAEARRGEHQQAVARQQSQSRPAGARPARVVSPPPLPGSARPVLHRTAQQARPVQLARSTQQASHLGGGVRDEMNWEQQRRDQEDVDRQQRLGSIQSSRTRPTASAAQVVALAAAEAAEEAEAARAETAAEVRLDTIEGARQAILYHEIFSPPKALRSGTEPWEL